MNWRPMPSDLPERDWRIFRKLRQKALDLYCARVLADIAAVIADTSKSNHDRYLELHRLIRARERDLAHAFDRMTRAHAMFELCSIAQLNLLTDEELSQFSQPTQDSLQSGFRQVERMRRD